MNYRRFQFLAMGFLSILMLRNFGVVSGATIFFDDFQSIAPGSTFDTTTPAPQWGSTTHAGSVIVDVQEDVGNTLFGGPTGNQYGRYVDPGSGAARSDATFTATSNKLLFISFDFHEISDVGVDAGLPTLPHSLNVQVGSNAPTTTARGIDFRLSNGELYHTINGSTGDVVNSVAATGDYAMNQKHHIDIVANFNSPIVGGNYGPDSVAIGTFDLWLNNQLVANNLPFRNSGEATASIDTVRIGTDNVSTQTFYIDNFAINDDIVPVPEPTTWGPLTVGSVIMFLNRRKFLS